MSDAAHNHAKLLDGITKRRRDEAIHLVDQAHAS